MVVAYGVCVGSWGKLHEYVVPKLLDHSPLLALSGQRSIVAAYNVMLDYFAFTAPFREELEAVILQHDDVEVIDYDVHEKILAEFEDPNVALVGVAGGGDGNGLAWWTQDPIGHQRTDVMNIDFGVRTGEVTLLEGSFLAFSPAAIHTLRFDPLFTGFHGYDEISKQAHHNGHRVVVADIATWHHNRMGFKSPASHQEWIEANRLYQEKWGP